VGSIVSREVQVLEKRKYRKEEDKSMYELPDILVLAQQMNKELKGKTVRSAQFNERGYTNLSKNEFEAA